MTSLKAIFYFRRTQRDSKKIKYRLNEVVWHKMKIETQSFALHLHI